MNPAWALWAQGRAANPSATIQFKSLCTFLYNVYKMITLKEYEIYLEVKAFIEAEGCDKADIIP